MALFDKKQKTDKTEKAEAAPKKKPAAPKPKKAAAPKATPKPKPTTAARPAPPKVTVDADTKLRQAEDKLAALIEAIEPTCKKGAGLTGLQRRHHRKKLRTLAQKLANAFN